MKQISPKDLHGITAMCPEVEIITVSSSFIQIRVCGSQLLKMFIIGSGGYDGIVEEETNDFKDGNFGYIVPPPCMRNDRLEALYRATIYDIRERLLLLDGKDVSIGQSVYILPIAVQSTMVVAYEIDNFKKLLLENLCTMQWEVRELIVSVLKELHTLGMFHYIKVL